MVELTSSSILYKIVSQFVRLKIINLRDIYDKC